MKNDLSQISRLEYFKSERRQARIFSFFITFLFFSAFLVSSYYITWKDIKIDSSTTDLTLAVDLGNSTITNSSIMASYVNASKQDVLQPKDVKISEDNATSSFEDDVQVPVKENTEKKEPTKKKIPKALFSTNSKSNTPRALYQGDEKGEKRGREDGIVGGSQDLNSNGISVKGNLRNRRVKNMPVFKERFSENALIRVEVRVDVKGKVHFIRFGKSTTANPEIRKIVLDKLSKINFSELSNSSSPDQFGVLEFRLRVK